MNATNEELELAEELVTLKHPDRRNVAEKIEALKGLGVLYPFELIKLKHIVADLESKMEKVEADSNRVDGRKGKHKKYNHD